MKTRLRSSLGKLILMVGVTLMTTLVVTSARQQGGDAVAIDNDDIGGVVTGANGPEAGVWVIAETTDLPTRFAKIVVTDDRGRYLVPDLPRRITTCGCAVTDWLIRRKSRPPQAGS